MLGLLEQKFQDEIFPTRDAIGDRNPSADKQDQMFLPPGHLEAAKITPIYMALSDAHFWRCGFHNSSFSLQGRFYLNEFVLTMPMPIRHSRGAAQGVSHSCCECFVKQSFRNRLRRLRERVFTLKL